MPETAHVDTFMIFRVIFSDPTCLCGSVVFCLIHNVLCCMHLEPVSVLLHCDTSTLVYMDINVVDVLSNSEYIENIKLKWATSGNSQIFAPFPHTWSHTSKIECACIFIIYLCIG